MIVYKDPFGLRYCARISVEKLSTETQREITEWVQTVPGATLFVSNKLVSFMYAPYYLDLGFINEEDLTAFKLKFSGKCTAC
jgi:hypothetical protein